MHSVYDKRMYNTAECVTSYMMAARIRNASDGLSYYFCEAAVGVQQY